MAFFGFSVLLLILLHIYIAFNILLLPYIAKPVLISFLLISSATNYLMFKYGVYIDVDMTRNLFETNAREALDFFTLPATLSFVFTGIIPAGFVFFTKIAYKPFWIEFKTRVLYCLISFIVLACACGVSYKEYMSFGRNNREIRKLANPGNWIYATFRYFQAQARTNRKFVKIDENAAYVPYGDATRTIVIMIIGETARAKNFSLYGYERETNPLLAKQNIIVFNRAVSCGTATAISLPCIFSKDKRVNFKASDAKYSENLLDLARQSGYDVIWLENDDGCKGVCARVYTEDMVKTKNPRYCEGDYCKDDILVYDFEERLKKINKNTLIVLHTMGSHGPAYFKRYPDEFRKFTPTCDTSDIQTCSREQIVNTYDNTILYTDYIVSSIIDAAKKFGDYKIGAIYVSDHGESLGENNIYLHGFPYKLAPSEQKQIPMLIWMSPGMIKYDRLDFDCLKKAATVKSYSHDNIFHSVLSLLEIKSKLYDEKEDVFFECQTKSLPA
jgi:lipid A ethanolaminephosphotransferase